MKTDKNNMRGSVYRVSDKKASDADIEAKARTHYPSEGSHGWNHIQDVIANARRMRRRELLRKELAAIMYHDSSLMTGNRDTHAEDSAEIARKELAGLFRKRQIADIVNAIAHHRASYEGKRSSRLEDLLAAADRPVPDLAKQVARSWKYHEELGEPEDLRAKNVASHLKEKYGHGGYAYGNAPKLYLKTYGKELRDIMSKFDGLTPESVTDIMSGAEKKAEAHHPDIDAVLKAYKDRFGVDLSHVKFKWSRHPRYYDSGEVSREIPDDETGGSHGKGGIVWINPNLRPVMNKFNVPGKVKDFRRLMLAHELAHEIDDASSKAHNPELVKRLLAEAKKNNFRTAYTDTYDPKKMPRKFDKELFAEYVANLLTHPAEKKAEMSRDRIQAQYARHPQSSLDILAARLAKRKWGPEDVVREYDAHSREYDLTKEDKEFLDRYIIARIGEKYDRKARIKQALMRRLWEKEHNGESFDAALPYRMARFRQYENIPFPATTPDGVSEMVGTKTASSKKSETYESGIGKVVSYTPYKTKGHDEIVVKLKDGRVIRISNNTELGKRIKAKIGGKMGYHGYRIDGTNVVHKVHSNKGGSLGWLEKYPEDR